MGGSAIQSVHHSNSYITLADITYEVLDSNGDIGSSANTLCSGNDARFVGLATDEETIAGISTTLAVTPSGLSSRLAAPGPIGEEDPGPAIFDSVYVYDELSDVLGIGAFRNDWFAFRSSASGRDAFSWDMYYSTNDSWYSAMAASTDGKRLSFFVPPNPDYADFPAAIWIRSPATESGVPTFQIDTEDADNLLTLLYNGNLGLGGLSNPESKFCSTSVHIGGESDAGENNLLVDGTTTTSGIKIIGGTPGLGKIMTSDEDGNGAWEEAPTSSGGGLSVVADDTVPQLGGDLDTNEKNIILVPAPTTDQASSGLIAPMTCGETTVFGNVGYIKSDGKLWLSSATSATTMPTIAMALEAGSANDIKNWIFQGFVRNDSWDWAVGGPVYVDIAAGGITQTTVTGTGNQAQIVGVALTSDSIIFNPSYVLVEVV